MLCPFKKIYFFNFFLKTTMPWVVFHFWFDNLEDKRNLNCKIYELNNDVHQWPLEWGQICKEKASFSKLFLFIPTRGEGKKEWWLSPQKPLPELWNSFLFKWRSMHDALFEGKIILKYWKFVGILLYLFLENHLAGRLKLG